ncbi:MAG: Cu(I)/Ag(I) efflux system rane protein CusB/SilB [Bacteroidetes bacterium]|jgi:copper chaperone CopZ|nr:Cu(I)/Ag(I) efflux system rane protein CusB/SilB [Bacteroidota bacterium]
MKRIILFLSVATLLSINSAVAASTSMSAEMAAAPKSAIKHAMLKVKGNCESCKDRIEKAALSVKGVKSASWDQKSGVLHLELDSKATSVAAVSKAIAKVGHDTEFDKADAKTYNALPGCCKYKR